MGNQDAMILYDASLGVDIEMATDAMAGEINPCISVTLVGDVLSTMTLAEAMVSTV